MIGAIASQQSLSPSDRHLLQTTLSILTADMQMYKLLLSLGLTMYRLEPIQAPVVPQPMGGQPPLQPPFVQVQNRQPVSTDHQQVIFFTALFRMRSFFLYNFLRLHAIAGTHGPLLPMLQCIEVMRRGFRFQTSGRILCRIISLVRITFIEEQIRGCSGSVIRDRSTHRMISTPSSF